MQLHELKPQTKNKLKKIRGRGGKRGSYSGRGIKGQKSRAGRRIRPQLRDIIKKIPKKRGYKFKPVRDKIPAVTIEIINKKFQDGETVTPLKLFRRGLIKNLGKKRLKAKILSNGELNKKISVFGCEISKSAKEKILKAGGDVN